jgi:hypothetical protein
MPRKKKKKSTGEGPSISIGGNVGGSVAVGDHNIQIGAAGPGSTVVVGGETAQQTFDARQQATLARPLSPEEIAALADAFRSLEAQIQQDAPAEKVETARQQVEQLKEAVAQEKPDVPAMEKAKGWFVENLPAMLGGVTSILTHPIVGRLVEAAGEFTLDQFRQRLGLPAAQ